MITTTYDYSSGVGFTYDSALIGFGGGAAKLLRVLQPDPGLTFSPVFADATYDPNLIELNSGSLRQKDNRLAGFLSYFAWNTQLNGNYGSAGLTVTAFNGAAVAGGVLNLLGATNKYVSLPGGYAPVQVGTIAFKYLAGYTGTPAQNQIMFVSSEDITSNNSSTVIYQTPGGLLLLQLTAHDNSTIVNTTLGSWSPVSGTTYEFVLQVDVTTGATKLFIDGMQFGATATGTGSRAINNWAIIGKDRVVTSGENANFSISKLSFYDSIVAPANAFLQQDFVYNGATAVLPAFSYLSDGNVVAWQSLALSGTNAPRFILNSKFWNGSAWVASNGSFAQASTAAQIASNVATLPVVNTLGISIVFASSNTVQMAVASALLTYTGQQLLYSTSNPAIAPNTTLSMDELTVFMATTAVMGIDGVLWQLLVGAVKYWWNGSAWAVSNGSYAQASSSTDIQANSEALPIDDGAFVTPIALLHSDDGTTTPELSSLLLTYSFFGPSPAAPNVCTIFGYIYDETETPIVNATVTAATPTTYVTSEVVIAQGTTTAKTDHKGYFEFTLIETETSVKKVTFSVVYPAQRGSYTFGRATIPNVPEINFADLTFIA